VIADKHYYVNARRTRIVDRDDPEAAFLLAAAGEDISNEDVRRYGLDKPKKKAEPETKAVESAPDNKAMKPAAKK
jgi:hypothetical protein